MKNIIILVMAESDLPWSAPISCALGHPAKPTTRFWSAWDAPADTENKIEDPLRTSALVSKVYTYGAPRFMMNRPFSPWYSWRQRPRNENFFSIPIVTFIEPGAGVLSLMVAQGTGGCFHAKAAASRDLSHVPLS